MLTPAMRGEP